MNAVAQPLEGLQAKWLDELCAVDADPSPIDDLDLLIYRGKDPLDGAVSRILKTSLDRGDHRLGYSGAVRKAALG